jgi:hypothetical protein
MTTGINAINSENVSKYLNDFLFFNKITNKVFIKYFNGPVYRWIINTCERIRVSEFSKTDPEWSHYIDLNKTELYRVLITNNLYANLIKIRDFLLENYSTKNFINITVDKILEKHHASNIKTKSFKDDDPNEVLENIIYKYLNNFYWLKLTPSMLQREGALMNHCVNSKKYYDDVKYNKICILSLRDQANNPHLTVEILLKNKSIVQSVIKLNKQISETTQTEYIRYFNHLLTDIYHTLDTEILKFDKNNIEKNQNKIVISYNDILNQIRNYNTTDLIKLRKISANLIKLSRKTNNSYDFNTAFNIFNNIENILLKLDLIKYKTSFSKYI